MTPAEWLVKLRDQAPHYFKGNGGGGAAGGKDEKIGGMSAEQIARSRPKPSSRWRTRPDRSR
jgi:hypothetical protein